MAYQVLVPWPGIKPVSPALEVQSLNHLTSQDHQGNSVIPFELTFIKSVKIYVSIYILFFNWLTFGCALSSLLLRLFL